LINTEKQQERAVLVAVATNSQSTEKTREYLQELALLAGSAGVQVSNLFMQKLEHPDARTYVGKGKLEEIAAYVKANTIDLVIFDDDLSPSQVRNLEQVLECEILDRTLLILSVFSRRAQTAQARIQVELAQYHYLLPRLTRRWSHLSRQSGDTGTRGGPGETALEADRRIVRDRITLLQDKLDKIEKQSNTRRKSRENTVRVALVGYTNAGKSTLMRSLAKADVVAENKLFATLDATVRKVVHDNIPFLLTDTVGFIRKLPTTLVESFKSTLDEIREADILLHVVDVSHPGFEEQMEVVNRTLMEIGAANKPAILVFNKVDLRQSEQYTEKDGVLFENSPEQLKATYWHRQDVPAVFISAQQREQLDELWQVLMQEVGKVYSTIFPNSLQKSI
jgi:GTP-binding protein HflX